MHIYPTIMWNLTNTVIASNTWIKLGVGGSRCRCQMRPERRVAVRAKPDGTWSQDLQWGWAVCRKNPQPPSSASHLHYADQWLPMGHLWLTHLSCWVSPSGPGATLLGCHPVPDDVALHGIKVIWGEEWLTTWEALFQPSWARWVWRLPLWLRGHQLCDLQWRNVSVPSRVEWVHLTAASGLCTLSQPCCTWEPVRFCLAQGSEPALPCSQVPVLVTRPVLGHRYGAHHISVRLGCGKVFSTRKEQILLKMYLPR
jgi:hypothetical protein